MALFSEFSFTNQGTVNVFWLEVLKSALLCCKGRGVYVSLEVCSQEPHSPAGRSDRVTGGVPCSDVWCASQAGGEPLCISRGTG